MFLDTFGGWAKWDVRDFFVLADSGVSSEVIIMKLFKQIQACDRP